MIMNAPVVQAVVPLAAILRYPVHHQAVHQAHQAHQVAVQVELQLHEEDSKNFNSRERTSSPPFFT